MSDEYEPRTPDSGNTTPQGGSAPVPPDGAASQSSYQAAHAASQSRYRAVPVSAQYQDASAGAATAAVKEKRGFGTGVKAFIGGLIGAALATVLILGITGNLSVGTVTTTSMGSGSSTEITVEGEDTTLAEAVAAKCVDSVVCIYVYTTGTSMDSLFGGISDGSTTETQSALGSGVILSEDGYILTNYHVIEDASSLQVSVNGETLDAEVIGTDESSDLAVIKVDATGLTAIEIGSSSDLTVGEWVMAIGSPYGMEQSVSTGIVSATNRSTASLQVENSTAVYTNMIQTDAAINSGNSGGALVDSDGKLIGINTLIASSSGSGSGVGFAIPVDYATEIAGQLMDGETPSHAQLGVSVATIDSSTAQQYDLSVDAGAYVNSVSSGSGAEDAGIQVGDIITKVGDTDITSADELIIAIRSHDPGDTVKVTFVRDGETQAVEATLGKDTDSSGSSRSAE